MTELVAVDVGGTHARFALAEVENGRVPLLDREVTLKTADHPTFDAAWEEFARQIGRPLPRAAAIAVAARAQADVIEFTNNPWVIRPTLIPSALGFDRFTLVNDFGAVAHAVALLDNSSFASMCGPELPLPREGVISIIGPGTGLGVAQLLRREGRYHVVETEGGHTDFAPLDPIEDRILAHLRQRYGRVSVERIASGQGLANIYEALAAIEERFVRFEDEMELWQAALASEDELAAAAFDRFCLALGAAAGDIALAQGANAVVIAGGLGQRLARQLPKSSFYQRFIAKGRFKRMMEDMPVKLITHPQPGLFGAAAAFAMEHGE